MNPRIAILLLALMLFVVPACAAPDSETDEPAPGTGEPTDDPSGSRIANGLYDIEDGKVQAIGVLEYIDLEGGFYAITGAPGNGGNIAVIVNSDAFSDELAALEGKTVSVIGMRSDGPSVRMAGPEILAEYVDEITDTPGIAE